MAYFHRPEVQVDPEMEDDRCRRQRWCEIERRVAQLQQPYLMSGPTRPIGQKPMKLSWKSRALSQRSTGKSRILSLCPNTPRDQMPENPSSGPVSSMSLLIRNHRQDCFVRIGGITRATIRIGLANVVYNMRRFLFLDRISATT